jgi:membrane fusion protein (multidrug efflux system)
MTRKKKFILCGLILMLLVFVVQKFRSRSHLPDMPATVVQASAVKEAPIPVEVHAIGTLVAAHNIEITPEMPGHVVKILFQDGALVEAGASLIQLNDAAYKTKYQAAKARLALSENKFQRVTQLAKKNFVSKQTMDEVEADLKERRADAEESEVMLNRMRLSAPFAGVVGKSKVNPGDYVTTGQPLVTLTDVKHLRIEFSVPERYLSSLKIGQDVKITTVAYPGREFVGKLAFIAPTINADNRSIALYAEIPNSDGVLKAGMFVDVMQSLGSEQHALMVPSRALVATMDGQQVYKVVSGKASAITVMIGKRVGDTVQITQGLTAGDVVITDGQLKVKNGMPVKMKEVS